MGDGIFLIVVFLASEEIPSTQYINTGTELFMILNRTLCVCLRVLCQAMTDFFPHFFTFVTY